MIERKPTDETKITKRKLAWTAKDGRNRKSLEKAKPSTKDGMNRKSQRKPTYLQKMGGIGNLRERQPINRRC
jgi:hypothetical protein